jgi:hypothetical protein
MKPYLLSEAAVTLITNTIKTNIAGALASVRNYAADGAVTTEVPASYFIYPKATGYRCPAVFVVDENTDFRQANMEANFIDARMSINVTVKVEDKDQNALTIKSWRYASALQSILEQSNLVSPDGKVKLSIKVRRIKPGPMYVLAESEAETSASFFKEYDLFLDVDFFESF